MDEPISILLIDDDNDDHEILLVALKMTNLPVALQHAYDGEEAIASLKKANQHPHLILLDLNMPRMNGKQCLKAIRAHEEFNAIPIHIYSTTVKPEIVEEAREMGASGFIEKPSEIATLVQVLTDLLRSLKK